MNEYIDEKNNQIFHFDFYRLDNIVDVQKMGFDVYIDSNSYCFIEWPSLIESWLPTKHHVIQIEEIQNKRELRVLK